MGNLRNCVRLVGRAALTGTGAAVVSLASAQTPAARTSAAPADEVQEVTVTGSRVIRNGNDSPTPVTVITVEDIQTTRPTTVFEGLLDMPVFAGSRGAVTNPGAAGSTNNNISALSLRGLGQARTLILYDGHRVPPTQENGFVNINMIPQMLLQRVDVVTGGVSAVYGSDGVSGVVNFITDRRFNGIKANIQTGISDYDDDRSSEFGIAAGMDLFGGRGHIEGSLQAHKDDGVPLKTSRQFGRERWTLQGSGTAALPYFLTPDATLGNLTFGGKIVAPNPCNALCQSNPLLNQQFVDLGVLGPFTPGSTTGVTGNIQIGGDGAYHTSTTLKAMLNFQQAFGRFDFDLTDSLHYFLTGSGTVEHSYVNNTDQSLNAVTLSATNAFLPAAYQTAMTSRGITTFNLGKMYSLEHGFGPTTADDHTRQWMVNTGLEGRLGEYRWEGSYTHGTATEDNRQNNSLSNGRLSAALDAVVSNGQVVCNVTVTNPGLYPGCVPLNVFGVGSESAAAIAYITQPAKYKPRTTTDDVSGSIAGSPFNTWAGAVNMALSAEWRKLGYELVSNSLPALFDPLSCTGLRFNCTPFNATTFQGTAQATSSSANRPPVSQTVAEGAIEAEFPLLRDLPFVQSVSVNTAYRYARYTVTGAPVITDPDITRNFIANTWKAGIDWKINDAIRVRATRSRDFRAPTLIDLYAPANFGNNNMVDMLTNITPTNAQLQTSGNPNLVPEVGFTTTLGIVVRPTEKLSLSIDAYDITVRNAIINASGFGPNAQTSCYQSGGTSFYCTLQVRPVPIAEAIANPIPANTITKYLSAPANVAEQSTYGADTEVNYSSQVAGHPFSLRGLVTYQPHALLIVPGANVADFAGVDFSNSNQGGAVVRATGFVKFGITDNFTVDMSTRYRRHVHHNSDVTVIVGRGDPNNIPSILYSNLNLAYRLDQQTWGQANFYLNIQNVFNQPPIPSANAGPQGAPGNFGGYVPGDDPIGRYFSVGMRYRL
jgi:iron complex outermembrane receptor protein